MPNLSRDYLTDPELFEALECAALELERRASDDTFRYQAAAEQVRQALGTVAPLLRVGE